jgi:hypothetical protein
MKYYAMAVYVFGQKVFLAGSRSERGELIVVATNQHPRNAIAIYLRRWEIESLFQSLKGRGFHFENTHITQQERIAKLIALLAIGFAWAHKVGEWLALHKPIVIKHLPGYLTHTARKIYKAFFLLAFYLLQQHADEFDCDAPANCVSLVTPTSALSL